MLESTRPAPRTFGPLTTHDGRLVFLDLARGLAVVFMVCQHVQIMFAIDGGEGSPVGELFLLLGTAPAAPVFMVAMGFLFGCSAHTPRRGLLRGLGLVGLGYLLNLLRFTIPLLIAEAGSSADVAASLSAQVGSPLEALFTVDILQLAGLSLIVLSLVKPVVRDPRLVALLALAVFAVSPLLWGLGGAPFTDPLWGGGQTVAFPLFPWLGYPLLGLMSAQVVRRADDGPRLMKRTALVALFVTALGGVLLLVAPSGVVLFALGDYFQTGLPVQLVVAGFVFLWLPALWWLAGRVRLPIALRFFTSLSRHLTAVYVAQWVLIGWAAFVLGIGDLAPAVAALAVVPVVAVSHVVALAWSRLLRGRRRRSRRAAAG